MNYRHGYHAGNFADVLKHTALCELLRLLTAKDKKLFVLDTHAGAGGYDLGSGLARRTGEAEAGIARLVGSPRAGMPPAVARYLAAVAAYDRKFGPAGRRHPALSRLAAAGSDGAAAGRSLHRLRTASARKRWRSSASSPATARSRCARPTATRC